MMHGDRRDPSRGPGIHHSHNLDGFWPKIVDGQGVASTGESLVLPLQ